MKKITVITLFLCGICSVYSQITQEMYDEKVIENFALKDSIKSLQKTIDDEKENYRQMGLELKETSAEQTKKINDTQAELNGLKEFRKQRETFGTQLKTKSFDDLIKSSSKESVQRDRQLIGSNTEVEQILNDLQTYFNAEELLSQKFDAAQIKNAQTQLSKIKRQSKLLDTLKENVDYYKDFNTALKGTIEKIVNFEKMAYGDPEIQKRKFDDIVIILADYMYNYYDYENYPHLSNIVIEIIKRKKSNADADITDLLNKL